MKLEFPDIGSVPRERAIDLILSIGPKCLPEKVYYAIYVLLFPT